MILTSHATGAERRAEVREQLRLAREERDLINLRIYDLEHALEELCRTGEA